MNVLFLGPPSSPLVSWLKAQGERVECFEGLPKNLKYFDFLISYNYRFILRRNVLRYFPNKAINLHISLLPWNRGADPNFWSHVEGTPSGVSIHLIDACLDTGAILCQKPVSFSGEETLESSYVRLHEEIQELFRRKWQDIKYQLIAPVPQPNFGTYHKRSDKDLLFKLLPLGWQTKIKTLPSLPTKQDQEGTPKKPR